MGPRDVLAGAALALAVAIHSGAGRAETATCSRAITRVTVVPCALATSSIIRGERAAAEAVRGRELAAGVLLPSNPVFSVELGRPIAGVEQSTLTWSASLAQEVEIGGQRGARLEVARAEATAQGKRTAAAEREAAAAALVAYFDAVAARDQRALVGRLADVARALEASATTRAEQGLAAPIDADVAYAASLRLVQMKSAAEARAATALAALASAVGLDPTRGPVTVEGELEPLSIPETSLSRLADQAVAARAEIGIAEAEGAVHEGRAALLRRARIPNVTLSVFAQNDSLDERVVGGGISVPIPLPGPLGRTNEGEIAEATALARRAGAEVERWTRQVRLEVATAGYAFAARRRELDAFDAKRIARTEESLTALGQEVAVGRLSIRDAIVSQQALIELLQGRLEARRALCVASVELARAAGMPLERGVP